MLFRFSFRSVLRDDFRGIVDLVTMKAEIYHNEDGTDYSEEEIPEEMQDLANKYHETTYRISC